MGLAVMESAGAAVAALGRAALGDSLQISVLNLFSSHFR